MLLKKYKAYFLKKSGEKNIKKYPSFGGSLNLRFLGSLLE